PSATQAQFLFEIRPASAGPIDPRPILAAWQLLAQTAGHPRRGTQALFGPSSRDALISEIGMMSQRQGASRLLADPRLRVNRCGRGEIAAARVDRRVLAVLDFLVASGLEPTVSKLRCGQEKGAPTNLSRGDAARISALDRVPLRGHYQAGSLARLVRD